MASTKTVTVLDNNITLTAGAGDHTSGLWSLLAGYGGLLLLKITNGGTGPTLAGQAQVQVSPDNSNWYSFGGALIAQLGNGVITSWAIPIPIGAKYVRVISGSNTDQDVVIRAEGVEVTAIS